jgi:O-antigen/teichoic acid export membrane protein
LFNLVFIIALACSVAALLVLLFFARGILAMLGKDALFLMQVSSILILLTPVYSLATGLFQGFKRFGSVLKVVSIESILNLIFACIAIFYLGFDFYGVLYAKIASLSSALLVFLVFYRKLSFSKALIDWKDLKRYIVTAFPLSISRGWEDQSLTILLGLFIGNLPLGIYYMANKIASLAIVTPITSLRDVLLPYSLEKSQDLKVIGNYASLSVKLALTISILLSIILLIVGMPVLSLFFPAYVESYWLFPLFALSFIISSLTILHVVYTSVNRLEFALISSIASVIAMIVSGLAFMPSYGIYGAVIAQIISSFVGMFLLYFFLKKIGIQVQIIPRLHDLAYFYSLFINGLNRGFKKAVK